MIDLSTRWLGLDLPHPLMPGASPLVDDLDRVRRLEDAGAAAIVMHSLFEEQIAGEQVVTHTALEDPAESFAEALSYFPEPEDFRLGPDEYLEQIRRIREAVSAPVIGSLNGTTPGGWLEYARLIEEAGAAALELNVYRLVTDPRETSAAADRHLLEIVQRVREAVSLPLAVKLSPFHSSIPWLAREVADAGVRGLVLFNRFYQPDVDPEELEVTRTLRLSDPSELLLRLRWLAILHGRVPVELAVSGGVHTALEAVKAVMCGASAVQMVSALLARGPEVLAEVRRGLARWLEEHEYESLEQMRGSMSLETAPDPHAYERAGYVEILQSYRDVV